MSEAPAPDTDVAIVLGMASTAMPFARSAPDEAERWLRILRLHGRAGVALQALGVSEAPLEETAQDSAHPEGGHDKARDVVSEVNDRAALLASERGAREVSTGEVLVAVMEIYGEDFDRVLRLHGTDREEVLQRLAA